MANFNKRISDTNIRIGLGRFSYPHLFERRRNIDGTPGKYEVSFIIPKTETETIKLFKEAYEAAYALGVATKWGGKKPVVQNPLHDGDEKDDPAYKNCYYISAKSDRAPGVRVRENGVVCEALDAEDVYAGCYGAITVNLYPYDVGSNRGVAVGLQNVIKIEDGERLAGGRSADEDFADL